MKLLEKLCGAIAPSGAEETVNEVIREAMAPLCDEITTDALGNLLCHKKGEGAPLLLETPIDSVGLAITHIEEDGRLRVENIGDLSAAKAVGHRFAFADGRMALCHGEGEEADMASLFLDPLGEKGFAVGDASALSEPFVRTKCYVASPSLSARLGAYCLIKAAKQAVTARPLTFVFAAQGQLFSRGACVAAFGLAPSLALSVDAVSADGKAAPVLGGGPAVLMMDKSIIPCAKMRDYLVRASGDAPLQRVVSRRNSDAGALHTSGGGILTGGLAVPCRYYHTAGEMADIGDIEGTIRLLSAFMATA